MSIAAESKAVPGLTPLSLRDAPSFIERQFPVGRLSAEAYKERKAVAGQTLTGLGSYWKGRKPLILVRAVVIGALIPATEDQRADLDIFLKLMAMDDGAFGRRFDGGAAAFVRLFPEHAESVATNIVREWRTDIDVDALKEQAALVRSGRADPDFLEQPILDGLATFVRSGRAKKPAVSAIEFAKLFPRFADAMTENVEGPWRWRDDLSDRDRQERIAEAFTTLPYAERLRYVRRPEECDETELLEPIWFSVNRHCNTTARNLSEFISQVGLARFGRRPTIGDTFCGAGSIPFEAARLGCDAYASDLNPIACMLTWAAFNVIGGSEGMRRELDLAQQRVASAVDAEICRLGIEHDSAGNRAKAYLYCLETRCPRTGWMVPILPSLIISETRRVIARLQPDHTQKRYDILIETGVSLPDLADASNGTLRDGRLVHPINPERSGVDIKTIRADYRDSEGEGRNRLRLWEKSDFQPRIDDVFQERLYCIQWIRKRSLIKSRPETFFASITNADIAREERTRR